MAKKTFEECKKGDTMYLLDPVNGLEIKKVILERKIFWYGEESFDCEIKGDTIRGCIKARTRCQNLFTTEEEALAFKASIKNGEKVFYTVKTGDIAYIIFDGESTVKKGIFVEDFSPKHYIKISYDGTIYELGSNCGRNALDNKLHEDLNWHYKVRLYVNEKDAIKSAKESERRKKKNATDKYLKSLKNHDGKPISHTDNLGSELHYGDTVAYIRRVGINGHPELRKGVIVGEAKTTITVFDEDEKKNGKPGMWRREPNEESHGKHSLQPQSVLLFKLAEVNENSGFILTK